MAHQEYQEWILGRLRGQPEPHRVSNLSWQGGREDAIARAGDTAPLEVLQMLGGRDRLNMTLLALNMSSYVNGVAKRHGEASQDMFPEYAIDSITNGVHSGTWTCESFATLYDRHIPGWA